jgi:hypothetical protein
LLDLELAPSKTQGTVFPAKHNASIARELPNPAADEMWNEWDLARFFPVTGEDIFRMGKDPSTVLENAVWGLGDNSYLADYDMNHQIHCLNLPRKIAYSSYYNITAGNPKKMEIPEIHINHCVEILLQRIQCSSNVNLMTYHWLAGQENPVPDMQVPPSCNSN